MGQLNAKLACTLSSTNTYFHSRHSSHFTLSDVQFNPKLPSLEQWYYNGYCCFLQELGQSPEPPKGKGGSSSTFKGTLSLH